MNFYSFNMFVDLSQGIIYIRQGKKAIGKCKKYKKILHNMQIECIIMQSTGI